MTPLIVTPAGREARQIDAASPPARLAAVVGERMSFRFVDSPLPCKLQALQAPAPPEVHGNSFRPNAPGVHVVNVDCGQWSTTVRVFAVWPSLLDHPHFATVQAGIDRGQARKVPDRWRIVEALVSDGDFPEAAFTIATPARPLPSGVVLQPFGG